MPSQTPNKIEVQGSSRCLKLDYPEESYRLSFEFLRVHSPSAEVRGHGVGNAVLQTGKQDVIITAVEPAGNYGLKLVFSDGHDSGIYTWPLLKNYCENQELMWSDYLAALESAGASRAP